MIRFGGYLGLVLFLGGSVLRLVEPAGVRGGSGFHGAATAAALLGFALLVGRLGDVAANSHRTSERVVARVGLLGMFVLFIGFGFLGVALLLSSPAAA